MKTQKQHRQTEPSDVIMDRAVNQLEGTIVNGHGVPIKLLKLLDEYQRKAAAVQTVINLLTADAQASSAKRMQTTLRTAAITDAARRTHHAAPARKVAAPGHGKIHAQRKKSAAFLATFSTTEARMPTAKHGRPQIMLGPLVRRGYLQKADGGYVRTDKAYVI